MIKRFFLKTLLVIAAFFFACRGTVFAKTDTTKKFLEAIQKENECISAVYKKYQGALEVARCKCWPDQPSCLRPPGEDPACPEKYVPEVERELKECRKIADPKKTASSLEVIQTSTGDFYKIIINRVGEFTLPIKQKAIGVIVLVVPVAYIVYRKFKVNKKVLLVLVGLGLTGVFLLVSGNIKIIDRGGNIQMPEIGVSNDEAQKAIDAVAKIKEVQDFKKLVEKSGRSKFGLEIAASPTEEMPYYLVQVFEIFPDHRTTFNWYRYSPDTKKVTQELPQEE